MLGNSEVMINKNVRPPLKRKDTDYQLVEKLGSVLGLIDWNKHCIIKLSLNMFMRRIMLHKIG